VVGALPSSLDYLVFGERFNEVLAPGVLPANLTPMCLVRLRTKEVSKTPMHIRCAWCFLGQKKYQKRPCTSDVHGAFWDKKSIKNAHAHPMCMVLF
jgi:hypothetical protein